MVKTVEEEKLHLCDPELLKDVLKFYSECLIISRMINENKKARDEDRKDNGTTTASLALRQEQQRLSVMKRTNVTEPEKVFRQRIKAARALTVAAAPVHMHRLHRQLCMSGTEVAQAGAFATTNPTRESWCEGGELCLLAECFSQCHLHNRLDQEGVWDAFEPAPLLPEDIIVEGGVWDELWRMVSEVSDGAIQGAPPLAQV